MKTNNITKYLIGLLFVVVAFLSYLNIRLEDKVKDLDTKYTLQNDSLKKSLRFVGSKIGDHESRIDDVDNENDDLDSRISNLEDYLNQY